MAPVLKRQKVAMPCLLRLFVDASSGFLVKRLGEKRSGATFESALCSLRYQKLLVSRHGRFRAISAAMPSPKY
jgi:hypothetical protein